MATIPQFQGSGAVPNRALMLGTPNTCGRQAGGRRKEGRAQGKWTSLWSPSWWPKQASSAG